MTLARIVWLTLLALLLGGVVGFLASEIWPHEEPQIVVISNG